MYYFLLELLLLLLSPLFELSSLLLELALDDDCEL
jgi:hypothetical protein